MELAVILKKKGPQLGRVCTTFIHVWGASVRPKLRLRSQAERKILKGSSEDGTPNYWKQKIKRADFSMPKRNREDAKGARSVQRNTILW